MTFNVDVIYTKGVDTNMIMRRHSPNINRDCHKFGVDTNRILRDTTQTLMQVVTKCICLIRHGNFIYTNGHGCPSRKMNLRMWTFYLSRPLDFACLQY